MFLRYRELGKTKLRVSEIGFGCGNVGGLMVRGTFAEQVKAVSRAIDAGINYYDTAPRYGDGASETNLGKVMKELQPKNVIVATKFGLRHEDLQDIRGAIQKSLKDSLSRLNRDSIDVFLLHAQVTQVRGRGHRETLGLNDVLGPEGVADILDEARSNGLIDFSGLTGLGETEALHQIVASQRFDVIQIYYNLLNPTAGIPVSDRFVGKDFKLLIEKASKQKMGVAAIRVLAGGALGGETARQGYASSIPGPLIEGSDYKADADRAEKLRFLIAGEIRSLPEAAMKFALMNEDVSTALVGFSNLSQIEDAVRCSVTNPFPKDWMKRLQELWATDFERNIR